MTTFPLRRLRLRSGDEHREPVAIALEPFELGGERYLPVPADADAVLEIQRFLEQGVDGIFTDQPDLGARARAASSRSECMRSERPCSTRPSREAFPRYRRGR